MSTRVGSTLTAVLVALAPAMALAQMPPGMPNMEEMMRQQGMGAPGGPRAGRGPQRSPAPPGVPVPPDSPLIAAFHRLDAATAYRVRMDLSTTDPRSRQAMQQMGMERIDKAVVKPDTQYVSFHMIIPAVDLPGKSDDWEVRSVVKGTRMARKFETAAAPRILALQEASIAKQMAQADMAATMGLAQSALGGPIGWISGGVQLASVVLSHAAAAEGLKKSREFFEWTCSDAPAGASASHSPDSTTFTDLVDLGERVDGDVPVHGYQFFVRQQGQYYGPIEVDIARATGLPSRFTMSEPSMGATMVMHYADYGRPATIEIPPCLAK